MPYPLTLRPVAPFSYFEERKGVDVRGMLFSPMMLVMYVMLGIAFLLPKLTAGLSEEELREMRESNPLASAAQQQQDLPDVAAYLARMTNPLSGSAPQRRKSAK